MAKLKPLITGKQSENTQKQQITENHSAGGTACPNTDKDKSVVLEIVEKSPSSMTS